ncbi:MAG: polysaccharide biosynthesis/export family protein [Planctomycetota bacterium]
MTLRSPLVLLAAAAAMASACVGPDIEYGEVATVMLNQANPGGYRLSAGDQLQVNFAYHPERNIGITVRPDGKVSMPFAEEVQAAGRTIEDLDQDLTERVSQRLKNADLTVLVQNFARQRVYVGGEVTRPGERPLVPGETVYQAIAASGWFRDEAAQDSVVLVRATKEGERQALKLDFSEDALLAMDVELQPFDIIYVPKTSIARVGVWVEQYINRILPRGVTFGAFTNLQTRELLGR